MDGGVKGNHMKDTWKIAKELADLIETSKSEEEVAALCGASDTFLVAKALCLLAWRREHRVAA